MMTTFNNPTLTNASQLGISLFEETTAIELMLNASEAETEIVIRAIYRQVLGNAHVMESERLTVSESQLISGGISVREFVRQVAKSELYRSKFFENCPRYRFIELNFKHLLGRTPENYEEMTAHSHILDTKGYEAEIDSYLDSQEYETYFGENTIPYYVGYKTQTGKSVLGFSHFFEMLKGSSSSDRSDYAKGSKSRLQRLIITNTPSKIAPLSNLPAYQGYKPITDGNQIIAKALGIKTYTAVAKSTNQTLVNYLYLEKDLQYQYQSFEDSTPIELCFNSSPEETEIVIRAIYRQVLGNAHVMESERLTVSESQLISGEISVREFVRRVAKSELYRSRFFDNCPRYRAIELNFKHLLGVAPDDYSQTFYHSQILDQFGFEAEIDSYLDSDEYCDHFGENIVPFYRGYKTQTGKKLLGFTNMFKLLPSVSTSDKAGASGNQSRLAQSLIHNNPKGFAPVTDIQQLLAEVLKPKVEVKTVISSYENAQIKAYQDLKVQCEQQKALIKTLQQQLANLQPFASIGAAHLSQWQSSNTQNQQNTPWRLPTQISSNFAQTADYQALGQQSAQQQKEIASLQEKVGDATRFATIGEARLNKWRKRTFSR